MPQFDVTGCSKDIESGAPRDLSKEVTLNEATDCSGVRSPIGITSGLELVNEGFSSGIWFSTCAFTGMEPETTLGLGDSFAEEILGKCICTEPGVGGTSWPVLSPVVNFS